MFQVLKSPGWRQGFLAGSLFLVLGWGLLQTPEAGTWLFPERFWGRQARIYEEQLLFIQMRLEGAEAQLKALQKTQGCGFPQLKGSFPPTQRGLHQAIARTQGKLQSRREDHVSQQVMLQRWQNLRDAASRKK